MDEPWEKETPAQFRDRLIRTVAETKLQDALLEERQALVPTIRDFRQREREKEGLEERSKAAQRAVTQRVAILALIATIVIGTATVIATILASHSVPPVYIQAPAASFTPYPTLGATPSPTR